ncbi:TGACG-sequence-specific DNA-binding protein TGA-1A [Orobanche minor]
MGDSSIDPREIHFASKSENTSHGTLGASNRTYQEANKPDDKVLRRLAQNREDASKSHLWKKAYIHQLENIELRLLQLEQELDQVRQ